MATTDFTYDFANRLSSIAHKKGTTNLNTHSYTYDPLSRLRSITSTLDGTINYTYDQRSQLTIADDGQPYSPGHPTRLGERYQYDANGNREGTGFTVLADNDNRITAAPGETYTYDNEGNVISMITSIGVGSKSFQWDHRNRLTQSTVNTSSGIMTVNYAYDPFNRLVKRSAGFNTTYFGYDEGINPHLQMDTQTNNQITHRYLWSDQVDELFADEQRLSGLVPDTKWALSDHQGTIKDIADFNPTTGQTSVRHRAYDSFGNRKGSALPTDIVFGYTGKYFDETTGMQNSWNRWYSPKMGRFISQDPIGFAGGDANLYRYTGNSPTNRTDPSGLISSKEVIEGAIKELKGHVAAGKIDRDEAYFRLQILRRALQQRIGFEEPASYRNSKYWTDTVDSEGQYTVRKGKKPHEAIDDIWKHGTKTRTGCRKATDLIVIEAYIDHLRNKYKNSPDELAKQLGYLDNYIGHSEVPKSGRLYGRRLEATATEDANGGMPDSSFIPGDNVTFDNPFYDRFPGHGLQGSNVFYAGNGVYVGYDGKIWDDREAVQNHMGPWVPGSQRPEEFPASSANCPAIPKP